MSPRAKTAVPSSISNSVRLRHQKYYITDELVTFAVEDQLFRVHRYFFEWESDFFKSMFALPPDDKMVDGTSDETALQLPGVTVRQFESLLDFLYFRQSVEDILLTQENWVDLLDITTRYGCENIRKRAIQELERCQPPIDPVKRILLAIKHDVPMWLKDAYILLCIRPEPLEESEAEQLGIAMTVKVGRTREKYRENHDYRSISPSPVRGSIPNSPQPRTPESVRRRYNPRAERIVEDIFGI